MKTRFIDAGSFRDWNNVVPTKGIYKWVLIGDELIVANVGLHIMVVLLAVCRTKQQFLAETDGATDLQKLCARYRSQIRAAGKVRCDGAVIRTSSWWQSEGFGIETPEAMSDSIIDALAAVIAERGVDRMEFLEMEIHDRFGSDNKPFTRSLKDGSSTAEDLKRLGLPVDRVRETLYRRCESCQNPTVGDLLCAIKEVANAQ